MARFILRYNQDLKRAPTPETMIKLQPFVADLINVKGYGPEAKDIEWKIAPFDPRDPSVSNPGVDVILEIETSAHKDRKLKLESPDPNSGKTDVLRDFHHLIEDTFLFFDENAFRLKLTYTDPNDRSV